MLKKYIILRFTIYIYFIIFIIFNTFCQTEKDSIKVNDKCNIENDTLKGEWIVCGFLENHSKIWSSPFKIKKKDLRIVLPALSALTITFGLDNEIRTEIQKIRLKNHFLSNSGNFILNNGVPYSIGALSFLIYLGGEVSGDDYLARTGFMCMEALAHTGITVYTLKMLSGRQRPFYENGIDKWHLFPNSLNQFSDASSSKYTSFPSGHAAIAFSVASIIASRERNSKFVPIAAYSAASLIALSRIIDDKHYASDVLAGSLIGYGIGKMIINCNKSNKWTLFPSFINNNMVISASYNL